MSNPESRDVGHGADMAARRICEAYNPLVDDAWHQWQSVVGGLPGYPLHTSKGQYRWPPSRYIVRYASHPDDIVTEVRVAARFAGGKPGTDATIALQHLHAAHVYQTPLLPSSRDLLYQTIAAGTAEYDVIFRPLQQGMSDVTYSIKHHDPLRAEPVAGEVSEEGNRRTAEYYGDQAAEYINNIAVLHEVLDPRYQYADRS